MSSYCGEEVSLRDLEFTGSRGARYKIVRNDLLPGSQSLQGGTQKTLGAFTLLVKSGSINTGLLLDPVYHDADEMDPSQEREP